MCEHMFKSLLVHSGAPDWKAEPNIKVCESNQFVSQTNDLQTVSLYYLVCQCLVQCFALLGLSEESRHGAGGSIFHESSTVKLP